MLLRVIVGVGQVSLALLMVWLCRYFIDVAIKSSDSEVLVKTIIALIVVVAGNIALRQIYFYTTIRATAYQANAIRLRIFGHLLRRRIYDETPLHSGDVTSRLETDVSAISEAVAPPVGMDAVAGISLVGSHGKTLCAALAGHDT